MADVLVSGTAAGSGSASASLSAVTPSSYVFLLRPEVPYKQIVEFKTDVQRSYSGLERRIGLRLKPRERYEGLTLLPTEFEIRRWHRFLSNGVAFQYKLFIWQDQVVTTAQAAAAATTIFGDFSVSDLAIGAPIALIAPDEALNEEWEEAEVLTIASGQITITVGLATDLPLNSAVVPIRTGKGRNGIGFGRAPQNAANFPFETTLDTLVSLGGNGGTALSTYRSLTFLDRRPLNNGLLETTFHQDTSLIDFGNIFEFTTDQADARTRTVRRFLIETKEERQYWKLFLMAVLGRREPFFTPTYRNNLITISNTASSILVQDDNNYTIWYETQGSRDDIQVETDTTVSQHRITSAVDNLDGTVTLNVDGTITGTVAVVSFLEVSRLASDVIEFNHYGNYSLVSISVQTINESQA